MARFEGGRVAARSRGGRGRQTYSTRRAMIVGIIRMSTGAVEMFIMTPRHRHSEHMEREPCRRPGASPLPGGGHTGKS